MATLIEKNLPYKIYSASNLGSREGMFYLGKVPNNINFSQKIYSDDYYQNCFSGYYFSIASLVPGGCVRMDIADEADSSVLIDAKWYDFRPACTELTCDQSQWPTDNILRSVDYSNPMAVVPSFKGLATDGTVVISGLESSFIWNDEGIQNGGDTSHCTLYLQAWKYIFENCNGGGVGPVYGTIGVPGESDVIFLMKSLVGGENMAVDDLGTALLVRYTGPRRGKCLSSSFPSPPISCEPYIPSNIGTFI